MVQSLGGPLLVAIILLNRLLLADAKVLDVLLKELDRLPSRAGVVVRDASNGALQGGSGRRRKRSKESLGEIALVLVGH